jgi:hypothetical protein
MGGLAQPSVQQSRITQSVPELALKASDRIEILRGATVLIRG